MRKQISAWKPDTSVSVGNLNKTYWLYVQIIRYENWVIQGFTFTPYLIIHFQIKKFIFCCTKTKFLFSYNIDEICISTRLFQFSLFVFNRSKRIIMDTHFELICCMPNMPAHFLHEAKLLSCGHHVCAECIHSPMNEIECSRCSQLNKLDVQAIPISRFSENVIECNLEKFSGYLYDELVKTKNDFNCM